MRENERGRDRERMEGKDEENKFLPCKHPRNTTTSPKQMSTFSPLRFFFFLLLALVLLEEWQRVR